MPIFRVSATTEELYIDVVEAADEDAAKWAVIDKVRAHQIKPVVIGIASIDITRKPDRPQPA